MCSGGSIRLFISKRYCGENERQVTAEAEDDEDEDDEEAAHFRYVWVELHRSVYGFYCVHLCCAQTSA